MAGNDKEEGATIPSWQQAASTAGSSQSSSETASEGSTLEQARKFLQDEEVRLSSREKKIEFLKSKGIEEADIDRLLDEAETTTTSPPPQTATKEEEHAIVSPTSKETVATTPQPEQETRPDQPPIITYPEFLTKPAKPPPLITASGLLNSLGVVAGLSSLVYGATRYLVSPMVENLNEARTDFHQNANENLSRLLEKLEQTVSEIPPSYHHAAGKRLAMAEPRSAEDTDDDDEAGSSPYDDPSELFHRDVGVQTEPTPSSPSYSASTPGMAYSRWPLDTPSNTDTNTKTNNTNSPAQEADRLNSIISSVRGLSGALISQADDLVGTKDVLDRFGEDLHTLTYPPDYLGASGSFVYTRAHAPPDDEITRVKNSIRGVKGVLLSTRSFPAGTR